MVARPDKLAHLVGELGGTAGRGKWGPGSPLALPERKMSWVVL